MYEREHPFHLDSFFFNLHKILNIMLFYIKYFTRYCKYLLINMSICRQRYSLDVMRFLDDEVYDCETDFKYFIHNGSTSKGLYFLARIIQTSNKKFPILRGKKEYNHLFVKILKQNADFCGKKKIFCRILKSVVHQIFVRRCLILLLDVIFFKFFYLVQQYEQKVKCIFLL